MLVSNIRSLEDKKVENIILVSSINSKNYLE